MKLQTEYISFSDINKVTVRYSFVSSLVGGLISFWSDFKKLSLDIVIFQHTKNHLFGGGFYFQLVGGYN